MSEQSQPKPNNRRRKAPKPSEQMRPDPSFKGIIGQAAEQAGLKLLNVELPQLSVNDLIIAAPDGLDLSDTMFHFFNKVNLIEFKSENDTFTEREFSVHVGRPHLFFARNEDIKYSQMLTVFICSHYPQEVIDYFRIEEGIEVTTEKEWLLRYQFGPVSIALVVCRLLPLEERYYQWLMFAPSGSVKWQEFVTIVIEQGNWELLKVVAQLKPLEVAEMVNEIKSKKTLPQSWEEQYAMAIQQIVEMADDFSPKNRAMILSAFRSRFPIEGYLSRMTPEEKKVLLEKLLAEQENKKADK